MRHLFASLFVFTSVLAGPIAAQEAEKLALAQAFFDHPSLQDDLYSMFSSDSMLRDFDIYEQDYSLEDYAQIEMLMDAELGRFVEEIVRPKIVGVLADVFTLEEITALYVFATSPGGRSAGGKIPLLWDAIGSALNEPIADFVDEVETQLEAVPTLSDAEKVPPSLFDNITNIESGEYRIPKPSSD